MWGLAASITFAAHGIYWLFMATWPARRPRQAGSPVAVERTDSQAAMTNGADDSLREGVQKCPVKQEEADRFASLS